ncbi:DUF4124 domain-containing protein, partial [Curvibacter soli]|uniref:DUF4124 domain-containing protein n=1 Tax=Curvibacter soli TaxID=3031331 RepID=UPI003AEFEBA3
MKHCIAFAVLAVAMAPAFAVNKCKGPDGRVVYQDAPCADGQGKKLDIQASAP